MKKLFLSFLCLSLLNLCAPLNYARQDVPPPPAPAKPSKVIGGAEVYYFEATNKTKVQTNQKIYEEKKDGKLESLTLQARFSATGQKVVTPDHVQIDLLTQTYTPKFATPDDRHLTIYIDGIKLGTGDMNVINSIKWGGGNYSEWVSIPVDFASFSRIAKAKIVTMRVGKIEFELKDAQLEGLRDMLKTIEQ